MARYQKQIILPKYAENVQTTQYTPVNVRTDIVQFTATNTTATAQTLSVHLVPVAGVADASNKIIDSMPIGARQTVPLVAMYNQLVESGMSISTLASAASSIVISASGDEIS